MSTATANKKKNNSDFYDSLDITGPITLASRIKRLYELMFSQTQFIYDSEGINFKPTWFTILYLLRQEGPQDSKTLSQKSKISPSGVSQILKDLSKRDYINIKTQEKDSRFKEIEISKSGEIILEEIIPVVSSINITMHELLGSDAEAVLNRLDYIEEDLNKNPLYRRNTSDIQIREYEDENKNLLHDLYASWVYDYYQIPYFSKDDDELIRDPKKYIIKEGGRVFFAFDGEKPIGTIALIKHNSKTAEVAKIYLDPNYRGKGIGERMMSTIVSCAKEDSYEELILSSNHTLKGALRLYEKFGFRKIPTPELFRKKYGEQGDVSFKRVFK